jgi:hypothetical protein
MSAGTGELESSDSDEGVRVPITVTRLAPSFSQNPSHPAQYPVQSILISTATVSIVVHVAGFNQTASDQALISIARELINSTPR